MPKTKAFPNSLHEAIRYFSDKDTALTFLAALRWPKGVTCPACDAKDPGFLKTRRIWKCKDCGRQFSVKLGTIFEDSPVPLQKWLPALWMLVNCRNGVSSYEISRALGVSQKAGWFMLHRLRLALQNGSLTKLGGGSSPIEVDETFIGGKARNMHKSRRLRLKVREQIWSKTVVMGMLERGGKVKTAVIAERKRKIVDQIVRENIVPGAEVHTDEFPGYMGLADEYAHKVINHLEHYVDGKIHTQGIENFWSCLKRELNGTYIAVEPFHLFRYVDEQAFRFNNRKDANGKLLKDSQRFELALSQIAGKRLTFAEVTGKVGENEAF